MGSSGEGPEPLFTAAVARGTLGPGRRLDAVVLRPRWEIPLGIAALLLSDMIGGPCAYLTLGRAEPSRISLYVRTWWHVHVLAAEITEAEEVLRAVESAALSGTLDLDHRRPHAAFRWHGGELVSVLWKFPGAETGAVGQLEWPD